MKKLFFLLFCMVILPAQAQEQGNFKFSASTSRASFKTKNYTDLMGNVTNTVTGRTLQSYGIAFEYYVGDYVSIYYNLEFGNTTQGARYMRYPAGIQMAVVPLVNAASWGDSDLLYLAMLLAIMPEAVHLHIPVQRQQFYITPYFAPLTIYREKLPNRNPTPALGFAIGSKIEIFHNNFAISPYLGTRTLYRSQTGGWGLEGGFHIGLLLGN
jgi:hypothetical protein